MTKEQAIEVCKQLWGSASCSTVFRVLQPGIDTIDSCLLSNSYQTKQEQLWAALFRELAEALAQPRSTRGVATDIMENHT